MFNEIRKNAIAATIRLLVMLNSIFEIRILRTSQGTVSGYFDNPESAITAIESYIGKHDIYFTLNPPDPSLLERSYNMLTPYTNKTTSDSDIKRLYWLLVDIDPIRKSGIASTTNEKKAAAELASIIYKGLSDSFGFPDPIICDSGNGIHLLYHVDLDNTPENVNILKNLLGALDVLYSNGDVKVDRVTFNPARITKLYGVKTVKGGNTPERPHRWSKIIKTPSEIVTVTVDSMNRVIDSLPKAEDADDTAMANDADILQAFDLEKWIKDADLDIASIKDTIINGSEAIVYTLAVCPWNDEHIRDAYITKFKNGGISAGCFHDSCSDKNWHSLRDIVEPEWREKINSQKTKKGNKNSEASEEKQTQFDKIMSICEGIILFSDQKEEPLARISISDNHVEIFPVESSKFKKWVARQFYIETNRAFSADAWNKAVGVLSSMALFDGKEERLYKRCAWFDNVLFYDLNDKKKQAVRITQDGWEIVHTTDVLFHRHKTMSEQVVPIQGATSLEILDKHYKFKHADDRILHSISLITKFLAHIPHPIDVVHGVMGASKSTTLRKDMSIVDPNRCDIGTLPKTRDELAILLDNRYFLCFDNLSSVSPEMSDLLCMAVTGGTFVKRKLYSNSDETVLEFMQPVSLNGINSVATKSDLLDRALLLELDRLSETERKTEHQLWAEFNADKPMILGLIFDILSKAISIFPTVKIDRLGRMADFTLWGYAVAEAAGIGGDKFLSAYLRNQNKANEEAVASHPVAYAVVKFMEKLAKKEWEGTATELLKLLVKIANDEEIDTKSYLWVRQPNQLSRRIREVKSNLELMGLSIEIKNSGGTRQIKIRNNKL